MGLLSPQEDEALIQTEEEEREHFMAALDHNTELILHMSPYFYLVNRNTQE